LPVIQKLLIGALLGSLLFASIYPIYAQFRVEPVVSWGQLGEWFVGILGIVIMVFVMKTDIKTLGREIREYVKAQNHWNDKQEKWNFEVREKLEKHGERLAAIESRRK